MTDLEVVENFKKIYRILDCKISCADFCNKVIECGGGGGTNIYNSDGTLTADRTLTQSSFDLTFTKGSQLSGGEYQILNIGSFAPTATPFVGTFWNDGVNFIANGITGSYALMTYSSSDGSQSAFTANPTNAAINFTDPNYEKVNAIFVKATGVEIEGNRDGTVNDGTINCEFHSFDGGGNEYPLAELSNFGNWQWFIYPNTRDDSATTPINFLYTDVSGNVLSAPITDIVSFPISLSNGGTGVSLVDPGADRLMFWDDSAGQVDWLTLGTNLSITGTTLNASGGSGLTVGTTTITSGTNTRILYDNAGTLGEYTVTGSGTTAVLSTTPTFTTSIIDPLIIGGTGTTSTLTYKTTTGVGTTGADHIFQVGNNGATEFGRFLNNGTGYFGGSGQSGVLTTPFFNFLKTQDAPTVIRVENQSTGTSAYAGLYLAGEVNASHGTVPAGSHYGYIGLYSSNLSTAEYASTMGILSGGDMINGIRIYADNGYVKIGTSPNFVNNDFVIYKYNDVNGSALPYYKNFVGIGTASPTARLYVTTAGVNSQPDLNVAIRGVLTAGYTQTDLNFGGMFQNYSVGTGTDLGGFAFNGGSYSDARATTTGTNVGSVSIAFGGNTNVGVYGNATFTKNSATNIGVLGLAINAGSSPTQCAGYFGLQSATPTFASAALICDNGSTTSNIFVARDNGTAVVTVADGGAATFTNTVTTTGLIASNKSINTTAGDSATINAMAGRFRKDTSGTTFTLTNSFITTNSIVLLTAANSAIDATATGWTINNGSGSATIEFNLAPTTNFDMNFLVIN